MTGYHVSALFLLCFRDIFLFCPQELGGGYLDIDLTSELVVPAHRKPRLLGRETDIQRNGERPITTFIFVQFREKQPIL
jgi:hypothetical protein